MTWKDRCASLRPGQFETTAFTGAVEKRDHTPMSATHHFTCLDAVMVDLIVSWSRDDGIMRAQLARSNGSAGSEGMLSWQTDVACDCKKQTFQTGSL